VPVSHPSRFSNAQNRGAASRYERKSSALGTVKHGEVAVGFKGSRRKMRLALDDAGFQFTNAKRPVRQPNAYVCVELLRPDPRSYTQAPRLVLSAWALMVPTIQILILLLIIVASVAVVAARVKVHQPEHQARLAPELGKVRLGDSH
jgi:hypothetical protein